MKTTKEQIQEIFDENLSQEETKERIDNLIQLLGNDEGCTISHTEEAGGDEVGCDGYPQKRRVVQWSNCKDPDDNRIINGPWGC